MARTSGALSPFAALRRNALYKGLLGEPPPFCGGVGQRFGADFGDSGGNQDAGAAWCRVKLRTVDDQRAQQHLATVGGTIDAGEGR